eukprot:TRINITY_DN1844_c0_g1_i4.p1 TRINITY_DN1844_c0_g1~~TRINITY_DN1844_c0_g1_i4.p1  ORF type:complete len:207 (+),score=74.72 TRINITY_DN1844_c0_g1_i4:319-939(+)
MDLRSYNDYLEMVEDIIYNLAHDIDRTAIEKQIKSYKEENAELIVLNEAKRAEENREFQNRLLIEEQETFEKKQSYALEEQKKQQEKENQKEKILDGLASGTIDASAIKKQAAMKAKQTMEPISIIQPVVQTSQKVNYSYVPTSVQQNVPQPRMSHLGEAGVGQHTKLQPVLSVEETIKRQQMAAGWKEDYVSARAIQEAFSGLVL